MGTKNTKTDQMLTVIAMYNITKGDKATKGNELGVFESLGDVYTQEDLDLFFSTIYSYV